MRLRRWTVSYLSIWQLHMTLSVIVALTASCWGFCEQAHGQNDHGACPKTKFHSYYRWHQAKQATPFENGLSQGSVLTLSFSTSIRTICLNDFQKVCLCWRSSIITIFSKLEGLEGDFKPRHGYTFSVSPDFGLKLCHAKTVRSVFNLYHWEAKRQLKVYSNNLIEFYFSVQPLLILR